MKRARRGGSAIEFALTLPVLFVMFGAVIEYGWFFFHQQAVLNAVRDGTRFGVTIAQDDSSDYEAEERAKTVLEGFNLDCSDSTDCQVTGTFVTDEYDYLRLDIAYAYDPIMGGLLPTPDFVKANFTMVLEDQS